MNTLISSDQFLPVFSDLTADKIEALVQNALQQHGHVIESIIAQPQRSFAATMLEKEKADVRVGTLLSSIGHLAGVRDTPDFRDAYERLQPVISEYFTALGQNEKLLAVIEDVRHSAGDLSPLEARAIALAIRDFQLSGVGLAKRERERFAEIASELSQLSFAYSNAVMDATEAWNRVLSETELDGIPDRARSMLAANAENLGQKGFVATLDGPCVDAILTFATNRNLRFDVYHAYVTRASDVGPHAGQFDNGPVMEKILTLRHEIAALLGFPDPVASSLATKMANDANEVRSFLTGLAERVRPQAASELEELRAFAIGTLGLDHVEPWDLSFVSERLRQKVHAIDEEEIASYFPVDKVLEGLFVHIQTVFGVTIVQRNAIDVWHEDVRHFLIEVDNTPIASLYVDLFARNGKRDGAWMSDGRALLRDASAAERPIAYLTCNFAPGTSTAPALLRHDDVVTLFHEMGHCLHHVLTEVDLPSIGGINGVEWDAVELPSQFHESFAWDVGILQQISRNVKTGEALPSDMIARMLHARNFQAAMGLLRQIELSLFDLEVHTPPDLDITAIDRIARDLRDRFGLVPMPEWNRFSRTFSHIFAGGYAAGYYSYLWAEQLSADAFEAFVTDGADRTALGLKFRKQVLAKGASRSSLENYIAFRGRKPDSEALLRQRGLAA